MTIRPKAALCAVEFIVRTTKRFMEGGDMVKIDTKKCTGCGGCIDLCPAIAISMINDVVTVNNDTCTDCKICVKVCPMRAPAEV
jgi:NAD-dependent dihydropyrimidine dehydrogenase PreA subunit